ncbi:MAG TPA: tetratricopeptide repeat protein [Verrucomicrobiales bacterium]|nr:tetratricopeptide repeat protein [Verrucomicrobiales bacterium]
MAENIQDLGDHEDDLELHGLNRELAWRELEGDPDNWKRLLDLAIHELTFCRYEEAKAAIDHAERVCPPKAIRWVLFRRGHLSKGLGDFESAIRYYLAAHELSRDDATFLIFAGSAAFQAGDMDRAVEFANRATQCPEGCIDEAWFNLGGYLLAMCRYSEARDCYLKALEIDPNYSIAITRLEDVSQILELKTASE